MALDVETGLLTANTGSATTTVSHSFGAAPKALILFTMGQTSTGVDSTANASFSFGFSDGTNHRMIGGVADDNVATTNCGKAFRIDRCAEIFSNGAPTSVRYVSGVTFNSSDFQLTWDGTPASAYLVGYILLGGSDITNVIVGTHEVTNATGAQSVTGLAFQPDFGIFIHSMSTTAGTATQLYNGIGFATSSTKEFTMCWGTRDAQTMAANIDATCYTDQAACMSGITAGATTVDLLADFTSFNSDGYTINVSNASALGPDVGYLLIKGGQWDVGTTTDAGNSANTSRTISTMSFQPKVLFNAITAATTDATTTAPLYMSVGAAASTSSETAIGFSVSDTLINTSVTRATSSTRLILGNGVASGMELTSFNSDGWTTLLPSGEFMGATHQMGWFAAGDNAVVTDSVKDVIQNGYIPFARS